MPAEFKKVLLHAAREIEKKSGERVRLVPIRRHYPDLDYIREDYQLTLDDQPLGYKLSLYGELFDCQGALPAVRGFYRQVLKTLKKENLVASFEAAQQVFHDNGYLYTFG